MCPCSDNGKLKMILKCGCVEVTFVRQMKRWNIIPEVGHHRVDFCELKETNTDTLRLVEGRLVELEHNDNQEIEVLQYCIDTIHTFTVLLFKIFVERLLLLSTQIYYSP